MAPFAKVGGLGDVVGGLSNAHQNLNQTVEVILPYYDCIDQNILNQFRYESEFGCPRQYIWDGQKKLEYLQVKVFSGNINGQQIFLLQPDPSRTPYFKGGAIYAGGYPQMEAYLFFCRCKLFTEINTKSEMEDNNLATDSQLYANKASLEFLAQTRRGPQIIHVHDWLTASVAMLFWGNFNQKGTPLENSRVIFTIHSIANSGEVSIDQFDFTGFPGEEYASIDKAVDPRTIGHNPERLNLLKGGIVYSNMVTTVSPNYAHELLGLRQAGFLVDILEKHSEKFIGLLNGIDNKIWNPENDKYITSHYSPSNLAGKRQCKIDFQKQMGLQVDPDKPMIICINRLVPQKGVGLIKDAAFTCQDLGCQFVLLGTGHLQTIFEGLKNDHNVDHQNIRFNIFYSEELSHMMYAAGDMVLIPSLFEPCGLTQLLGMRYGCIPIAHQVGGLKDTVFDYDQDKTNSNGFLFNRPDAHTQYEAINRAVRLYRENRSEWDQIVSRDMLQDFSWEKSAFTYLDIYQQALQK